MGGKWRCVRTIENQDPELFDKGNDPKQERNVSGEYLSATANMRQQYTDWWKYVTAKKHPLQRPIIGTDRENLTWLTAHDLIAESTDKAPWWPDVHFGFDEWYRGWILNESEAKSLPWAIAVGRFGHNKFSLYLHDKSAKK